VEHAFLSVLLMHLTLRAHCEAYNRTLPRGSPRTGIGIGMESGDISRIQAHTRGAAPYPVVDTCIGSCINVAARIETTTKFYSLARTVIGEASNYLLCRALYREDYSVLEREGRDLHSDDAHRLGLHDTMTQLNRRLCVSWI
jgi:hypothetical protein